MMMRKISLILILISSGWAQVELFREGDVIDARFYGEVLATNVYVTSHIPDLTAAAVSSENEMFQAGYARLNSRIRVNDIFTIGLGLTWWGLWSGFSKKNFPFVSEAFVMTDTLNWPFGTRAVIAGGRMVRNYGLGLLFSDFYGQGYNTFALVLRPSQEQEVYIDFVYTKISEGGGNQEDWFYFPVAINTATTKRYIWIYTKYDLENYGIVLRKLKRNDQPYAFNIYFLTLAEDRAISPGFNPFWTGLYIDVGPFRKFALRGEIGYMFGRWDAVKPIYNDFPDKLYTIIRNCDVNSNQDCPGFRFNSLAFTIDAKYIASETFGMGISYTSFQGDDGRTSDVYEGWFPPSMRGELSLNSNWSKWSSLGEIFTWGMKPGLYRDIFGSVMSDLRIINVYLEAVPYTIFHSLKARFDFFGYWEYWGPEKEYISVDTIKYPIKPDQAYALDLGYEFDLSLRFRYAEVADLGVIIGYFIPGNRLKYGWIRPTSLAALQKVGLLTGDIITNGTQIVNYSKADAGSFLARFWIYREINF